MTYSTELDAFFLSFPHLIYVYDISAELCIKQTFKITERQFEMYFFLFVIYFILFIFILLYLFIFN